MTVDTLYSMLQTLSNHKRSKDTIMAEAIVERLDKSFDTYNKELEQGLSFLMYKHEKSLIKRMNKLNKCE